MITFQTGHIDSCRTDGIGLTPSRQCIHAVRATTRRHGWISLVFPRYYFFLSSVIDTVATALFVTLCFASKEKTPSADARKSIGGMSLPATDDDCFRIAAVRPRATTSRRRLSAVSAPSGEGNMRKEVLHCWPPPLVFPTLFLQR